MFLSSELPEDGGTVVNVFTAFFNLLDNLTVIIYSLEIVLKWLSSFRDFWKNGWNIFDLFFTVIVSDLLPRP